MDLKKAFPKGDLALWLGKWWVLWILFFVYTAAMAAFIQFFALPYLFPQAHLGQGLFVLDATGFHQAAAKNAAEMMEKGWSAWQLRPNGHYPAGMASIFYYLLCPEPLALIPFNAFLHATAGCLVFFLLGFLVQNRLPAAVGAALFVLNPASLEWTAQIHRDGTFILGNLLILTAWLLIVKAVNFEQWLEFILAPLAAVIGSFLIWVSRPYWSQVSILACVFLFIMIFGAWGIDWFKRKQLSGHHVAGLFVGLILISIQIPFNTGRFSATQDFEYQRAAAAQGAREAGTAAKSSAYVQTIVDGSIRISLRWKDTPLLPDTVERKLYSIWSYRHGSILTGGKTVIDPDVKLDSARAFLHYLPRALAIGFLSPFPSYWSGAGSTAANSMGRRVVGAMTLLFYGCLAFFIRCAWIYRKRLELWMIIMYSTYGVLVFSYAYANIGILLRMRYVFFMLIVCMGLTFALDTMLYRKRKAASR